MPVASANFQGQRSKIAKAPTIKKSGVHYRLFYIINAVRYRYSAIFSF